MKNKLAVLFLCSVCVLDARAQVSRKTQLRLPCRDLGTAENGQRRFNVLNVMQLSELTFMKSPFSLRLLNVLVGCFLCFWQGQISAKDAMHITFDGPPIIAPGTGMVVLEYSEGGMLFTPILAPFPRPFHFARTGGGYPGTPDNGTGYLMAGLGSTLMFRSFNGLQFDLLSVDLAEYSTVVPDPVTVTFIGYRPDGTTVTESFRTDGIIDASGPLEDFQTFRFGPDFRGLDRVEVPTYGWSLDNLFVSVPEPGSLSLLLLGAALFWRVNRRHKE